MQIETAIELIVTVILAVIAIMAVKAIFFSPSDDIHSYNLDRITAAIEKTKDKPSSTTLYMPKDTMIGFYATNSLIKPLKKACVDNCVCLCRSDTMDSIISNIETNMQSCRELQCKKLKRSVKTSIQIKSIELENLGLESVGPTPVTNAPIDVISQQNLLTSKDGSFALVGKGRSVYLYPLKERKSIPVYFFEEQNTNVLCLTSVCMTLSDTLPIIPDSFPVSNT
jgi:hypothetical protein